MKQGENITEKIFPGANNKLIIETRKVEVFKINRPKPKKQIQVESKVAKKHTEKYSELVEEESNIIGKMFGEKYPTIESERKKGQKIKIKEPKIKVDQIKGSKDGRHGESSQESKKYGQIRKEGENITEKIFPGQNNTLINEKRKVEIFKLNQPKSKQDIRVSSKESGRHTGSMDSKKYTSIRKEGEKITDKIYSGQNDTIINERRKVEVFKIQKSKTKQDFRIDSRDKRKYDEGLSDSKEIIDTTVKRRTKIIDGSHTSEDSSLISGRKGDIQLFKKTKTKAELEKLGKEAGKYTEISKKETDFSQIEKQGENITEKIFPAGDNNLIIETRKVEVFKNKKSKSKKKLPIGSKEYTKYTETLKESELYEEGKEPGKNIPGYKQTREYLELQREREKELIKGPRKRGQKGKKIQKFVETDGITKKFIKERMAEIWVEESVASTSNRLTIKGQGDNRKNIIYGARGLSSEKRGVSTETDEINRINSLINTIKEKDNELNKIVNELKSHMSTKQKTYDTRSAGKISVGGIKKEDKVDSSTSYDNKVRKLINIIKDKDDKVNQLVNQMKSHITISTDTYDLGNRTFDESNQQISYSRLNTRGKDDKFNRSINTTQLRTQSNIKNVYDSGNKTLDEFDTIHTQNTYTSEKDGRGKNYATIKTSTSTTKNIFETGTDSRQGDYEQRITELETVIKEKDDELQKLVNQFNTQSKKSEFIDLDLDSYGLGILAERETWNDVVRECPINNLYICDRRDWNEMNEISQLDLSILSLGKNWDDIVEEERDALNFAPDEKDDLKHQKIELLQINGQSILDKWLDEIQPKNEVGAFEIQKTKKIDEQIMEKILD